LFFTFGACLAHGLVFAENLLETGSVIASRSFRTVAFGQSGDGSLIDNNDGGAII
jgi:hypothetical protein